MGANDSFTELQQWAETQAIHSLDLSKGLCLHASVALARRAVAQGQGGEVRFVRWRVRGDPAFREHWAVALDETRVLDLTSVQVDGSVRVLRQVAAYPPEYTACRFYPPQLVLDALPSSLTDGPDRYPRRVIWRLQGQVALFDIRHSLARGSLPGVMAGLGHLCETSYVLAIDFLLGAALKRLGTLLVRRG